VHLPRGPRTAGPLFRRRFRTHEEDKNGVGRPVVCAKLGGGRRKPLHGLRQVSANQQNNSRPELTVNAGPGLRGESPRANPGS